MARVVRSAETDVSVERIWNMLSKMEWQAWDPDISDIENAEGLIEGARFDYIMNTGFRIPSRITEVTRNRSLAWSGTAYTGFMGYNGMLELRARGQGAKITYSFAMTRPIGWIVNWTKWDQVVNGVEQGLAGIVRESSTPR